MTDELTRQTAKVRSFNRFYASYLRLVKENNLYERLSPAEVKILFELLETPGVTAAGLMKRMTHDRGYLSRIIKKLRKEGLIIRLPDPEDKRSKNLFLSDTGVELVEDMMIRSDDHLKKFLSQLNKTERAKLVEAMSVIESILS